MSEFPVVYRNFDGLDVSFKAQLPSDLLEALDGTQRLAKEKRQQLSLQWNGIGLRVAESGASGGYAFRADTGIDGETWLLKRPNQNDPWSISASVKSLALSILGLQGVIARLHDRLSALGMPTTAHDVSVRRLDYAVDFFAPDFVLVPDHFVTHSRVQREEYSEQVHYSVSRRYTGLRAGHIGARQAAIYDKRADILKKSKDYMWRIYNHARVDAGQPPLDPKTPALSRVWRGEFRVGKKIRGSDFTFTTWEDIFREAPAIFADMAQRFRLAKPSHDSNRSRWPNHPLWDELQKDILENFVPLDQSLISSDEARKIFAHARTEMLQTQILGTTASCVAAGLSTDDEIKCGKDLLARLSKRISNDEEFFSSKVQAARDRQGF